MNVMVLRTNVVVAVVLLSASGIAGSAQPDRAAQIPYAGKWKLNVAKSDFGERSLAFAESGSGEVQMTYLGQSYTFHVDGKDYPAILGLTAAWKQIDSNTWEAVYKRDAKLQFTDTIRLSADAKTLTINSKGVTPAGDTYDQVTVYERVPGGSGLVGTWKRKQEPSNRAAAVLELVPSGADGLTVNFPDIQSRCDANFDGKDYPCVGPNIPAGATLTIQKTGPRSFDMTRKLNGKPLFRTSFTVSDDGKTLTVTGGPVAGSEKTTAVYDRIDR